MTSTNPPNAGAARETAAAIEAAAGVWAAKADRGQLSDADRSALEAWAAADPRRAGAYARALAANAYLDRARALGPDFRPAARARTTLPRRSLLAGAGGLLAASLAAAVGLHLHGRSSRISTPKGDVRRVTLPEGSAVTLNTDTAIRSDITADLRRITLARGEALFDVAKDPSRPFVVHAGDVRVRAIGTSFAVRIHDDERVEVLVREGVVEVSRAAGRVPVRLTAQMVAVVPPGGEISRARAAPEAVERGLAWREGRLDLSGMTLGQAADAFARYSDRRILISDPDVAALKVAGAYSLSDPEGFARAAALSLGLSATPTPDGVRLRRAGLS